MAPTRAPKEPKKLPLHYLILSFVGLPVFATLLVIGLVGMAVILDEDKSSPLSQSQFGVLYWGLVQKNPYVSAITVNGGGLGLLVCGAGLVEHFKAKKLEAAAAASKADSSTAGAEAVEETKKAK